MKLLCWRLGEQMIKLQIRCGPQRRFERLATRATQCQFSIRILYILESVFYISLGVLSDSRLGRLGASATATCGWEAPGHSTMRTNPLAEGQRHGLCLCEPPPLL
jgi:hypothetical protein